jgi:phospholipase A-2-activating protein
MPPGGWFPDGGIISASYDHTVKVWAYDSFLPSGNTDPISTLPHDAECCFVTGTDDGRIIAGCWNSVCRIWTSPTDFLTLTHNDYAVWSAAAVPSGYITLGADRTIRSWTLDGIPIQTIDAAHSDVPRTCLYLPSRSLFVTAANDGRIKEWLFEDSNLAPLETIAVSDKYLYDLCAIGDDTYVVGSDDRCAYIVSSSSKSIIDVLPCPGEIWSVAVTENGDVVTASADGSLRLFTQSEARRAPLRDEHRYLQDLAALQFTGPELQGIDPAELQDITDLGSEPGVPGRAVLARSGSDVSVCVWSIGYGQWIAIGNVAKPQSAGQVADEEGRTWDMRLSIELDEGYTLPLYMNHGDNPYKVAQEFLARHELPQEYYEAIATFIRQEDPAAQRKAPAKVEPVFPMLQAVFFTELDTDALLRKLRGMNDTIELELNSRDFEQLKQETSKEWFRLVLSIIEKWPISRSWLILDLLRFRVLDATAPALIPGDELCRIVARFMPAGEELDDMATLTFSRLLANMFSRYQYVMLHRLDVIEIMVRITPRVASYSPRTQQAVATLLMNYSTVVPGERALALAVQAMQSLGAISEEEPVYRLVYAIGNAAVASPDAMEYVKPEVRFFTDKKAAATAQKVQHVLSAVIDLCRAP